jgi:trehalose 6-phosphate phosphatase
MAPPEKASGAQPVEPTRDWLPSALGVVPALSKQREPFVVLDYDGTLAPIAPRPDLATMTRSMREAVAALAARTPVAILSGRALDDVAARVGLDAVIYAGCHGLEIRGPSLAYRHPEAARFSSSLDSAAEALNADLAAIEGALVEHKGLAIAVHRRLVAPARHAEIAAIVMRVADSHPSLVRKGGKMVDELLPAVDWDKGKALRLMVDALAGERFVIFLGDDRTDEDAFAALGDEGAPIIVAAGPRPTAARYRLDDLDDVERFLRSLAT